jgi:hypothetical protein
MPETPGTDSLRITTSSRVLPCWDIYNSFKLSNTTTKVKTTQVDHSLGQRCGNIELEAYLADAVRPINVVLDLRITHERYGGSSNPSFNGTLYYPAPADIYKPLHTYVIK